jgi:hypothetical protein
MTVREAYPNPNRPERWTGEEDHYRSKFKIGDVVRIDKGSGYLGRLTAWDNTWSHVRGGRIAHYEPLLTQDGSSLDDESARVYDRARGSAWESDLSPAHRGDVAAHMTGTPPHHKHVAASWSEHAS